MKQDFISEIYEWFVAHKRKILNFAKVIIIACPIAIWLVYLFGRFVWGFPTDISADGILGYIAAILSSIATVFLGFITLALSNRANKINDDLLSIQRDQLLLETQPFIMFTKWAAFRGYYGDAAIYTERNYICINELPKDEVDISCLSVHITNTTKSYLIADYFGGNVNKEGSLHQFDYTIINPEIRKILLSPGETKELIFYGRFDFFYNLIGYKLAFEFLLQNHIGEEYFEQVEASITSYPDPFEQEIDYCFSVLEVLNYTIKKA